MNIGGHGFWDKGGVDTGGCPKKNFPAAFGGRKIFRRRRHRGVKIFFRWGVYLVDRGVILPKNPKKWPHRGVKIFFSRGAPPPVFFPPGVGQIFGLRGGAPPTVRWTAWKPKNGFSRFGVLWYLDWRGIRVKSVCGHYKVPKIKILWTKVSLLKLDFCSFYIVNSETNSSAGQTTYRDLCPYVILGWPKVIFEGAI